MGAEDLDPFVFEDYPNLKNNAQEAAVELDRLTQCQNIFWFPIGSSPDNLSICPGNLILTGSRPRVVHDWTKAGLNQRLMVPDVHYGTMDSFLEKLKPRAYMAGLDFQDCFLHWKVHRDSRRWLGLRHPITGRLGVFLFVPFGLGPAPGINDRNVAEVVRVCKRQTMDLEVVAFVDDLRLFNCGPFLPLAGSYSFSCKKGKKMVFVNTVASINCSSWLYKSPALFLSYGFCVFRW